MAELAKAIDQDETVTDLRALFARIAQQASHIESAWFVAEPVYATVEREAMVRFWVRDNGPGLTPDDQSRLFVPFTRLAPDIVEGNGVGLSIVQRIVNRLGGQTSVESEAGQGSIFSFSLPRINDAF